VGAPLELGVLADTHGRLRPEAVIALEGCAEFYVAGDLCSPLIVPVLADLAPTFAVAGNCDDDPALPLLVCREVAGVRILMHHGHRPVDESAYRPDVVITGHTHVPRIVEEGGVLRLNPGSAGPRRFNLPVTVARLTLRDGRASARLIDLPLA
jgi:putative phosphoesterase